MAERLGERLTERLAATRNGDGGWGPRPGLPSEPEPTALATLALNDAAGRRWLAGHQRPDGSLSLGIGPVEGDAATALAALALGPGRARERALDHVAGSPARTIEPTEAVPADPAYPGWPWTRGTFGWVEPTARVLLALRILRPSAREQIAMGVGLLRDRECAGGGWNYGNREVLDEELPPYGQTTALALVALQKADSALAERGLRTLRRLWRAEREGGLTLATSVAALRLYADPDAEEAERALAWNFDRTGFLGDTTALAWAAIATGPGLDRLKVPS